MKVAILLQCHKNSTQIQLLLNALYHPNVDVFVHVDKKANITSMLPSAEHIFILPDHLRIAVQWGKASQVDATLNLISYAKTKGEYDYFWLLSGQDMLLKSIDNILQMLSQDPNANYIEASPGHSFRKRCELYYPQWMIGEKFVQRLSRRLYQEITGGRRRTFPLFVRKNIPVNTFYFGSQWWCLTRNAITWMMQYLELHPEYRPFFSASLCADEVFFQTLFMLSPHKEYRKEKLCYVKWSAGRGGHPELLTMKHLSELETSDFVIARKFDISVDPHIVNALMTRIGIFQTDYPKEQ